MGSYTKSTNFATKDTLPSGNPLKIVRGTEIDTEFNNIATAVNSKSDSISPTFTGTVTTAALTATSVTTPILTNAGTLAISATGANVITASTNGNERVRIDSSGNVGIGTNSPDALFTVNTIASFGDGAVGTPSIAHKGDLNTGFWFPAVDTIAASTAGSERVRIDTSGNVGIGTSSPAAKLDVRGSSTFLINVANPTAWVSVDASLTTGSMYTQFSGSAGVFGTYSNHPQYFVTNNIERMRIDTSGNLLFNSGYGSVAIAYGCRAWVNFDGTTASPSTIRASGNVSSVTKNGTGDYTINFSTAMPDTNYTCIGSNSSFASYSGVPPANGGNNIVTAFNTPTSTSSIRVVTMYSTGTPGAFDSPAMMCAIFR